MKNKLDANDFIEIIIEAGSYRKSICGKADELGLVGFPLDWIQSNPDEAECFSKIIADFRCVCHDEFIISYGSYQEFSESYQIKISAELEDGFTIIS
jgi:hypothetical protein